MQATWALVVGSGVALAVGFVVERRLAPAAAVRGRRWPRVRRRLTLFFHDPRILKIKPTFVNTAFGLLLLGGLAMKKNPLKLVLGDAFDMPDDGLAQADAQLRGLLPGPGGAERGRLAHPDRGDLGLFRFPGMMLLTLAFSLAQRRS